MTPKEKAVKWLCEESDYDDRVKDCHHGYVLNEIMKAINIALQEQSKEILDECEEFIPIDIMFWLIKKYCDDIHFPRPPKEKVQKLIDKGTK